MVDLASSPPSTDNGTGTGSAGSGVSYFAELPAASAPYSPMSEPSPSPAQPSPMQSPPVGGMCGGGGARQPSPPSPPASVDRRDRRARSRSHTPPGKPLTPQLLQQHLDQQQQHLHLQQLGKDDQDDDDDAMQVDSDVAPLPPLPPLTTMEDILALAALKLQEHGDLTCLVDRRWHVRGACTSVTKFKKKAGHFATSIKLADEGRAPVEGPASVCARPSENEVHLSSDVSAGVLGLSPDQFAAALEPLSKEGKKELKSQLAYRFMNFSGTFVVRVAWGGHDVSGSGGGGVGVGDGHKDVPFTSTNESSSSSFHLEIVARAEGGDIDGLYKAIQTCAAVPGP